MKSYLFGLVLALLASLSTNAQSDRYFTAMRKGIASIDSAFASVDAMQKAAAQFERIGLAEKNQWLPFYYAGFLQVNVAFQTTDKSAIDALADKAERLVLMADSIQPNNSELSCLKSMIASARMMVNPMQRWQQYGPVSEKHITDAIQQDPTNPRPHFLKGQGLMYTPEAFGGGCKTAKPELEQAKSKFASFQVASELHPRWGENIVDQLMNSCK